MSHNPWAELSLKKITRFRLTKTPQSRKLPEAPGRFPGRLPRRLFHQIMICLRGMTLVLRIISFPVTCSTYFIKGYNTFLINFNQKQRLENPAAPKGPGR
jgi:hypothetical protein